MLLMIKKLKRKLQRFNKRIDELKSKKDILSKHGYWSLGYYEGKTSAIEDVLDELQEKI